MPTSFRSLAALLLAPLGATIAFTAPAANPASSAAKLGSTVFPWTDVNFKPGAAKASRSITNRPSPTFEIFESHITRLAEGMASHPPHQHAQEEFIIVKEGTLEVHINGKTHRAPTGSILFYASFDFHGVRNIGQGPATYMVFNYRTTRTALAPKQPAAESAPAGTLSSAVFAWDKLPVKETKTGERRLICDAPTVTLLGLKGEAVTLRAGTPAVPGRHPDEELVLVKEGTFEATINGKAERIGPGSVVFVASNDEHSLRNVGDSSATYYSFRMTTPATPAQSGR